MKNRKYKHPYYKRVVFDKDILAAAALRGISPPFGPDLIMHKIPEWFGMRVSRIVRCREKLTGEYYHRWELV